MRRPFAAVNVDVISASEGKIPYLAEATRILHSRTRLYTSSLKITSLLSVAGIG